MRQTAEKTAQRNETAEMLRRFLKPGDTVYCVLRNVSKSGMSRRIDFYVMIIPNGNPSQRTTDKPYLQYLSGYMSKLGIGSWSPDKSGLRVNGCGMDMGFHCVYTLARMIFTAEDCERTDKDQGYSLRSEWI